MEEEINTFLRLRPDACVVDLRLVSHASTVGNMGTVFEVYAVLIYESELPANNKEDQLSALRSRVIAIGKANLNNVDRTIYDMAIDDFKTIASDLPLVGRLDFKPT